MGGTLVFTWIMILCLSTVPVQSQYYSESLPVDLEAEKVTHLHFFLHETLGRTVVRVAQANITINDNNNNSSSVPFGILSVGEDILRIGPEPDSEVIGNSQGLGVLTGINATKLVNFLDFGFTKGKLNGSSISIFSRNIYTDKVRELAVVGGRGKFKMAKGFALLKTIFLNVTDLIGELNVTVIHY